MTPFDPPERPKTRRPPAADEAPANPIIEHADVNDEPAFDEVEILDENEFGEPIDESTVDEDADDWDKSEI